MYEAARSGAEYIFGDSVTGMAEVPGAVEVTFERAETRAFDLVIGADGLHSTLRALAFGPEPSFVRHLGMYLSVFTVRNDMGLDHWQLIHVSPGKSVTVTSARDNTEARAIFFFASPPLDYDHRDIGQQQELLEAAFAGQGWEIPRLLAAMRDAPDFYFDIILTEVDGQVVRVRSKGIGIQADGSSGSVVYDDIVKRTGPGRARPARLRQ